MLRKIFLSGLLAITAVTGFSMTPVDANAQPQHRRRHHDHYEVLYRHRDHWHSYGSYHYFEDARRAAWRLRDMGYDVRVEREHVH